MRLVIALVAVLAASGTAAQNYPGRPVTLTVGFAPGGGTDTVGPAFAREVLITGRQFKADEAKNMGFVHRVAPVAELEALVLEYCAMISENAPLTIRASKRIVRELLKSTAYDAEACAALVKACFESQDYIEGRRAFMEKRKPVFQGK